MKPKINASACPCAHEQRRFLLQLRVAAVKMCKACCETENVHTKRMSRQDIVLCTAKIAVKNERQTLCKAQSDVPENP
jgi:hypothetical protein